MNPSDHESEIVALLTEIQWPLRLYIQSLLPGDASARDVVQHANATIWRKRADFTPGTNFKAWAFSIGRYEVLSYRKQQARDSRLVFSAELEETFAEEIGEDERDISSREEALRRCLEKLRTTDRELLLHRYAGGGTLREYSTASGRSVGGLKVTLHRLRNTLLDCMQKQLASREAEG